MRCDEARVAVEDALYEAEPRAELRAHLADCGACSAFAAQHAALDEALAQLPATRVRSDFDTQFFARLAVEKRQQKRARYRHVAWVVLPMAAATLLFLNPGSSERRVAKRANEELPLVVELDMVRNLDVVSRLDELEAYDVLNEVDDAELARIAQEKP